MPWDATKSVSAMASPNQASVSVDWYGKISTGLGFAHAVPPSAAQKEHAASSPSIGPRIRWTRRPVRLAIVATSLSSTTRAAQERGRPGAARSPGPAPRPRGPPATARGRSGSATGAGSAGRRPSASLSRPPPVSSRQLPQEASRRHPGRGTPARRVPRVPASCEPTICSARRCAMPTRYTPSPGPGSGRGSGPGRSARARPRLRACRERPRRPASRGS